MSIVDIARLFLFVREASPNCGQRVEAIQTWSGGATARGTSWCAWFATMVLDLYYQGTSRLPRGGSTEEIHRMAKNFRWIVAGPQPGDIVLSINEQGVAHHVGIVTAINPLTAIAGNTSQNGTSSNGDRVAEHPIDPQNKVFVRVPAPPLPPLTS